MNGKESSSNTFADAICNVGQWEPYILLDSPGNHYIPDVHEAFTAVADCAESNNFSAVAGRTRLFIVPGYPFQT